MDYANYTDRDIFDLLEKADLAERIADHPDWKLLKIAAERIVERTIENLACNIKPDDVVSIMEAQITIRKYKYGLFEEVEILRQEAEHAFNEARDRGLLTRDGTGG